MRPSFHDLLLLLPIDDISQRENICMLLQLESGTYSNVLAAGHSLRAKGRLDEACVGGSTPRRYLSNTRQRKESLRFAIRRTTKSACISTPFRVLTPVPLATGPTSNVSM